MLKITKGNILQPYYLFILFRIIIFAEKCIMKKICYTIVLMIMFVNVSALYAQTIPNTATRTTVFEKFVPAIITLSNGKTLKQKNANIFLKNSSLVYKHGMLNMEADIEQIKSVQFANSQYVRVDTCLALVIDSIGNKRLLCASFIDENAYRNQLLNERQITNFELGEHVNVTSTDISSDKSKEYPLNNVFFFDINGKIVKVHERNIKRLTTSKNRRLYKIVIQSVGFSWDNPESLMKLLNLL